VDFLLYSDPVTLGINDGVNEILVMTVELKISYMYHNKLGDVSGNILLLVVSINTRYQLMYWWHMMLPTM
jgi:hypothetical protein